MLLVFWYRQRLVHISSSHLHFCQSLPILQRGLSATADLLVIADTSRYAVTLTFDSLTSERLYRLWRDLWSNYTTF